MKRSDADIYLCPKCRGRLRLGGENLLERDGEVEEGELRCEGCGARHPVRGFIPRFVPPGNYAASFGYQWKKFSRVQLGPLQEDWSRMRFEAGTRWPRAMEGQKILEAGCGCGRFSVIVLPTGAELFSFDLSAAVEACHENVRPLEGRGRHHLFQGSIYDIPLPHGRFDKIFCFGVLQHCPDVKRAYLSLIPFLKPGGELVVDCYLSQPLKHAFHPKYLLRPFVKWWKPAALFAFCKAVIDVCYPLKAFLCRVPAVGPSLARLLPIGRLNYEPEAVMSVAEIKENKVLAMFDMLSPAYDKCQRLESFAAWMKEGGLECVELTLGYNGIVARARRPAAGA